MHYPVMLGEALEYLAVRPDGTYLDATAGLGGHTAAIAARLTTGRLISADRDGESLELARRNAGELTAKIEFVQARFSELPERLRDFGVEKVNGLLADLGVSRYQLTEPERGFSLMADGPLDMRMSRTEAGTVTAADILNFSSEKEIADLIFRLGEEGGSRRVARAIVRARPIRSTAQLAKLIEKAVPRTGRLHPATRTFMALRQAVNDEPGELERLLRAAPGMMASGGRVVVITFMSLEDRMVKQVFQEWKRAGVADVLTKHVIKPSEIEVAENPPSRSAKLRAAEIA